MTKSVFYKKLTGLALGVSLAIGAVMLSAVASDPAQAQAQTKASASSSWVTNCQKLKDGKKRCVTAVNIIITKPRKQRIAGVGVLSGSNVNTKVIFIVLPLGAQLKFGYTFKIDENDPIKGDFSVCRIDGCHSELVIKDAVIAQMKKGTDLHLIYVNHKRQKIDISVSLAGFTKAYENKSAVK